MFTLCVELGQFPPGPINNFSELNYLSKSEAISILLILLMNVVFVALHLSSDSSLGESQYTLLEIRNYFAKCP